MESIKVRNHRHGTGVLGHINEELQPLAIHPQRVSKATSGEEMTSDQPHTLSAAARLARVTVLVSSCASSNSAGSIVNRPAAPRRKPTSSNQQEYSNEREIRERERERERRTYLHESAARFVPSAHTGYFTTAYLCPTTLTTPIQ
jgi:hypothetical protein